MADSNVRSNPVNVEQIMEQIRSRIRDQRGVEYTEQQIQELAAAQLEKYLDPRKVRSNLLEEFRRLRASSFAGDPAPEAADDAAVFQADSGWLRALRAVLRPITRLFFNTKALATVLIQSQAEKSRRTRDQLLFELIHNLIIETTRLDIEVKNLKMRNESLSGRVEFNERRVRTLEGAIVYQPSRGEPAPERPSPAIQTPATPSSTASTSQPSPDRATAFNAGAAPGEGSGRRRRRRRRGRRGGGQPAAPGVSGSPTTQDHSEGGTQTPAAEMSEFHDDGGDQPEGDDGGSDTEPQ